MIKQGLTKLNLPPHLLSQIEKVVMLSTCSIVRKLLKDEDSYLMSSLRTPNNVIYHIPGLIYLISKYPAIPSQQMLGPMTLGAQ